MYSLCLLKVHADWNSLQITEKLQNQNLKLYKNQFWFVQPKQHSEKKLNQKFRNIKQSNQRMKGKIRVYRRNEEKEHHYEFNQRQNLKMEKQIELYNQEEYFETRNKNKISKRAFIRGTANIALHGKVIIKEGAVIRGDLGIIKIGKYSIIKENVVLRPSYKRSKGHLKYSQMSLGEYVYIDADSVVCAAKVGNFVKIGKNCVISHRCVLKDSCMILDNSILKPDSVVAPFSVYGGNPATYLGELTPSMNFLMKEFTIDYFNKFASQQQQQTPKQVQE